MSPRERLLCEATAAERERAARDLDRLAVPVPVPTCATEGCDADVDDYAGEYCPLCWLQVERDLDAHCERVRAWHRLGAAARGLATARLLEVAAALEQEVAAARRPREVRHDHALDEVGECAHWCGACRHNRSLGLYPDGRPMEEVDRVP